MSDSEREQFMEFQGPAADSWQAFLVLSNLGLDADGDPLAVNDE